MKTIYADVVFLENFIVDLVLLRLASESMYLHIKQIRLVLSALFGGVYALILSIMTDNEMIRLVANFLCLVVLCIVALGKRRITVYIRFYISMYVFSFLLCGCVAMIPPGNVYVESVMMLAVLLLFVGFVRRVPERCVLNSSERRINSRIEISERALKLSLVCDSGNFLVDPYTKLPVIIVNEQMISNESLKKLSVRPVPFNTVSGAGIIWVITPQKVELCVAGKWHAVKASVGIYPKKQNDISFCDGIVPARIIENL